MGLDGPTKNVKSAVLGDGLPGKVQKLEATRRLSFVDSRPSITMGKLRPWKEPRKARASSLVAVPQIRDSWEKKEKIRAERAAVLAQQAAMDDEIRREKREERERIEAKKKKKEENRERGMTYQVITNTSKIKKMSRKQLRLIKKSDTSGVKPKIYGK